MKKLHEINELIARSSNPDFYGALCEAREEHDRKNGVKPDAPTSIQSVVRTIKRAGEKDDK
jgi:hypothetical protein